MRRLSLPLILLIALALRLLLLYIHLEIMTLPAGGNDEVVFENGAWVAATRGTEDLSYYLVTGSRFIVWIGSIVYSIFGRTPFILGLLMVGAGVGTVYFVYKATLELWEDKYCARIAASIATIFPQLALHSVLFLREIPVSFCLAAAAYCLIRYIKRKEFIQIIAFGIFISIGTLFHSAVIVALPAFLLGVMLTRPTGRSGKVKFYILNIGAVVVLGLLLYAANSTGFGLGKLGGGFDTAIEKFEQGELRDTNGSAAFPEWMRIRGGVSDTWKVPVRLISFSFAPVLPFMVRSPKHILGVLDSFAYLYLFYLIFKNWRYVRKNKAAVVLLTITLITFLVYSLGVSNFGTAIRHRAKAAPLLIIIAAGLPEYRRRQLIKSRIQINQNLSSK